jgi:DNA-binding transcriptional regulator YiaG
MKSKFTPFCEISDALNNICRRNQMNNAELDAFLKKYKLDPKDFAELIGVTHSAVDHWLSGIRSIAKPYGRLVRLFDRRPELMQEFK